MNSNLCENCNNFMFTKINPDDKEHLYNGCNTCGKVNKITQTYKYINKSTMDISNVLNNSEYLLYDKTLPTIKGNSNIRCTNKECLTNKEDIKSDITYIKYDSENMKYLYICNICNQKWKNS